MILKNPCCGNNMLRGTTIDIALFQFPITSIILELLLESDCFGNKFDETVYIDLRYSIGYTNKIEKLSRNNSKLTGTIELKNALIHKVRLQVWEYTNDEYLYMLVDGVLTLKYETCTIKLQNDTLEA